MLVLRKSSQSAVELDEGILQDDLIEQFWKGFMKRLLALGNRITPLDRFRRGRNIQLAARIRSIYAELMALVEALGRPRLPSQTPLEYLYTLEQVFPANVNEVRQITHAYIRIRYGEFPERVEEVERIELAWSLLRESARNDKLANNVLNKF